jgi:hypothetical protein
MYVQAANAVDTGDDAVELDIVVVAEVETVEDEVVTLLLLI